MSSFLDLLNEIILKVLSYSEITDILRCGQASKRIRTISNDKSLFHIVNLSGKYVTIAFIKTVLNKGCRSLKLSDAYIFGYFLGLNQNLQLRELDLHFELFHMGKFEFDQKITIEKTELV